MTQAMILWSHALAALLFTVLALSQVRHAGGALPRQTFVVALAVTALWALAVAGIGAHDVSARIAESLRNLAWLGFMLALLRRDPARSRMMALIYGAVAFAIAAGMAVTLIDAIAADPALSAALRDVRLILRMIVAISALLLVHSLYVSVAPKARGGIRLVVLALGAMWLSDLFVYLIAYAHAADPAGLIAGRGIVTVLLAPVLAVAVHRNGDWTLQLSRTVAYQSLSFAALALYLVVMALATSAISLVVGGDPRIVQTAFVFGTTAAVMTLLSTPWLRAWTKVKLAKHLFRHRYDYRAEWVRFTDTLGRPSEERPLEQRIVKALADLTDSPAGLLLVRDAGGLGLEASWNWERARLPSSRSDAELARFLDVSGRIIELDAVRGGSADPADRASTPDWMLAQRDAWTIVPLVHFGTLVGAVLLARPPVDRALDWEDFDLLRIAGRQAASYLAEARTLGALAEAHRFDEFNRRFAFILHDIKNLVSQMSLVARNAERHADNPAFRADMVATLRDTAERMNALLARLSQHNSARPETLVPVDLAETVARIASARRAQRAIGREGAPYVRALADPARLEQLLGHLVQNAIEASGPETPVTLAIGHAGDGRPYVEVIDRGTGMSAAFVRDQLFRPFVSSKPDGFGIGAFEARQLAVAMGGAIEVDSREGEGTRFRVLLAPVAVEESIGMGQAA